MTKIRTNILLITFLLLGLSTKAQKFSVESMKMELEDMTKPDSDRDYDNLLKWAEQTKVKPL